MQGRMDLVLKGWGKEISADAFDLLSKLLCKPDVRIGVDAMLAHPFLRERTEEKTESAETNSAETDTSITQEGGARDLATEAKQAPSEPLDSDEDMDM
jgi:hypothetical protein